MFKRIFTFFILLALLLKTAITFAALTNSEKWIMLQNFKRQEYEMIFESNASIIANEDTGILNSSRKINVFNSIWESVQSKREYLEFQNQKIVSRVTSLESSIAELDSDIEDTIKEVNKINFEIVETKDQIEIKEKTLAIIKTKIADNTQILLDYITYMYKKGDYISDGADIDTVKSILLSGQDIGDVINELHYKGIIQLTGQRLIEKHRDFISSLYIQKLELEKDELTLKQLRKSGMIEKSILDDRKAAKQRLLDITKGQEALYQQYIQEKLDIEKNIRIQALKENIKFNNARGKLLETYGCDFVDISKPTIEMRNLSDKCLEVNKIIFAESKLRDLDLTANPFSWPVTPYNGISAYFRDDWYRTDFNEDHDAIDIVVSQGTEIRAPADGYIVYIQPPTTPEYAYVAMKHGSGLVTIYGHLSEVKAEAFDFVRKWEVFALSGGEYGTKGAGYLTTGPHLHFWVYEDQEYADPLEFLDTSLLKYWQLQEKYQFKYKADFKRRKWFEYEDANESRGPNTFVIKGDTEVERQRYLLDTYAVGPFRDWNIWIEESLDANIDPTFVMCIGLAETTLWKYLKTPYNIGNVGNTDSGATVTFPNARSGIYAMAITLNNRFLWKYTEIQELSRYGNKTGSIYASSDLNWHRNIVKCMSHVKGEYVPDDYNFRITQ